jgi:hypothetical protein
MSFFPALVPKGIDFYRGQETNETVSGMEWLALEPEHAQTFAIGQPPPPPKDGTLLLQKVGTNHQRRETALLYFKWATNSQWDSKGLTTNQSHEDSVTSTPTSRKRIFNCSISMVRQQERRPMVLLILRITSFSTLRKERALGVGTTSEERLCAPLRPQTGKSVLMVFSAWKPGSKSSFEISLKAWMCAVSLA